jgi:hypothetical protein
MKDRRRFIRIPNSSEMKYEISGSPKVHTSIIQNISPDGACFLAKDFVPVGSIIKLSFSYEKYFYGGFARVVWIKQLSEDKYNVGVKFTEDPQLPENLIGLAEIRKLKAALKKFKVNP